MIIIINSVLVFIQLKPEIAQGMRGLVIIGDPLLSFQLEVFYIEPAFDVVVTALLPVFRAGGAVNSAVVVGRGQHSPELLKFVAVVGIGVLSIEESGQAKHCHINGCLESDFQFHDFVLLYQKGNQVIKLRNLPG